MRAWKNRRKERATRDVQGVYSLPVLVPTHDASFTKARLKKTQRLRLIALVLVHVLITVHLIHWWVSGRTVGRFVMSDTMETLELGRLNPGFILFSVALIVTLLAGRWLCGWGCHMGALQDACGWILRRVGVQPKPFRTRLIGYMPLAVGVYMFVWPTLRRDVLVPLLQRAWPEGLGLIGPWRPFPGWENAMSSSDLWTGMPGVVTAIPFLLICGGATVFFLGTRGFCRYGCPYGGMFSGVERFAPLRVRVDLNACDGCGKCTAACSSGVRVHEEVRAYGRVVSSNCLKTLDCVAVCPHDALSFGLAPPALLKKQQSKWATHRPKYDTTWREELLVSGVLVTTFFTMRGLYGAIPMLMAVGIAICAAGGVWWAWRCLSREHVRASGLQLKLSGRLTRTGLIHLSCTILFCLFLVHSISIRGMQRYAGWHDERVTRSREEVFHPNPPPLDPQARDHANTALRWYARSSSLATGGFGIATTPEVELRRAWLELVVGDLEAALNRLRVIAQGPNGTDAHHADIARVYLMKQDPGKAFEWLQESLAAHPEFSISRDMLAWMYLQQGNADPAILLYRDRLSKAPDDAECLLGYGSLLMQLGLVREAQDHLLESISQNPKQVQAYHQLASCYLYLGEFQEAHDLLERAKTSAPFGADSFSAHQQQIPTQ